MLVPNVEISMVATMHPLKHAIYCVNSAYKNKKTTKFLLKLLS